jgi:NAD(P)H dehydrogenase (quinone)
MPKALVCYYTRSHNTEKMAGLPADLRKAEDVKPAELLGYDCLVFGSPTYYGTMAWPLKKLIDDSVKHHGKLRGKIGGAFTSSGNRAGGNETTVLDILKALLIHGMIVQGDPQGDHYGPAAIGKPDEKALKSCEKYAEKLAALTRKLF